jgi:serine/threonine protein kinase
MAAVYKASRRGTDGNRREVVVKTLLPRHAKNVRMATLFSQEARLSTQLHHPNIVRALSFGFAGKQPYLELEYLSGWNVQQLWRAVRARNERLPTAIALAIGTEICRALAYAHSFVDRAGNDRPIIHRDVSPANVMIGRDGSVKLVDFGGACMTHGETLTIDTFFGKLAYMSPEQLERRQLDRRADVFALGVILHELLSGQPLFGGVGDVDTIRRVRNLVIHAPSVLNPSVPRALDAIVLRALERDPDQRYSSAAEMLPALEQLGAVTASQEDLLAYLGSIAPEVYTTTCEGCGQVLPSGVECRGCKTEVDIYAFARLAGAMVATPEVAAAPLPQWPSGALSLKRSFRARLRTLLLMLFVWWARLQNWFDARARPSVGAAAELFGMLWESAAEAIHRLSAKPWRRPVWRDPKRAGQG